MALNSLYQQIIMKHFKAPHGFSALPAGEPFAQRDNPACGDSFKLALDTAENRIAKVHIEGQGCAVSTASCSIMADRVTGMTLPEAHRISAAFINAMKDRNQVLCESEWGELAAFESVKKYRGRITCAILGWELLLQVIDQLKTEGEA